MGKIRLLPEHIANQIAAGEVVQRPASVVKELLENAIDAGAKHIKLIVKDGGKTLIQVVDDGSGMDETDARLSFERHATSKIKSSEDLFRITTKGFRGEALASIAAVSHVEMKTRPHDRELGTLIRIEGSEVKEQSPVQTAAGTSVAVKNLFFNVPARRKFLKSPQVEMRHIVDEFHRVALAYPELAFTLIHNGRELYRLRPSTLLRRILAIFGNKMEERLVPVNEETDYIKIYGFTGKPEFAKLKRGEQFFFVNKRFIKSSYLHSAVMKAYEGMLAEKKVPSYFLYFEIDPSHIDINIHPTKTEIKFDDEYTVYQILRASIRRALGQYGLADTINFDMMPELDFRSRPRGYVPEPKIEVDKDFNPFHSERRPASSFDKPGRRQIAHFTAFTDPGDSTFDFPEASAPKEDGAGRGTEEETGQETFQWNHKYIVSHTRQGILLIHQHRAHMSVLYDEFKRRLSEGELPAQQLMFAWEPDLLPGEIRLLEAHASLFRRAGFRWERRGEKWVVTALPPHLSEEQASAFIDYMLAEIEEGLPAGDHISALTALKLAQAGAIRTGTRLPATERQRLIARLFSLPEPAYAPDGKKNFIILDDKEISKRFQ